MPNTAALVDVNAQSVDSVIIMLHTLHLYLLLLVIFN